MLGHGVGAERVLGAQVGKLKPGDSGLCLERLSGVPPGCQDLQIPAWPLAKLAVQARLGWAASGGGVS